MNRQVTAITFILFFVSLLSSIIGAICGIGGGVIIKPVLDTLSVASVATVSFLSGCTVLSMSLYSVLKALSARESLVDFKTGTPMAIGAALGGILGKSLFSLLRGLAPDPERVGGYQAVCLGVVVLATLIYTLFQARIATHRVHNPAVCIGIGLILGALSSFLGIGGGPINLVVLFFFFSMPVKTAAQNSLYIILISQATSLLTTLGTGSVPEFRWSYLAAMVIGGIAGAMAGRFINKRLRDSQVNRLFIVLNAVVIAITCFNAYRFLS